MGKLIYGAPTWSVEFEDRALAHLRIVMLAKLRRSESFSFSWKFEAAYGSGRSSLWLHPAIPLQFEFYGGREPALNRAWIDELMLTANSPGGLELVPEPVTSDPVRGKPAKSSRPA
jgi:hypothetical protein